MTKQGLIYQYGKLAVIVQFRLEESYVEDRGVANALNTIQL